MGTLGSSYQMEMQGVEPLLWVMFLILTQELSSSHLLMVGSSFSMSPVNILTFILGPPLKITVLI